MPQRSQVIEIIAPTAGRVHNAPSTVIDARSMPAGTNSKMFFGVNQKEYGTTLYATGTGSALVAPINFMFDANFGAGSLLEVFTATGIYKYTSSGDTFVSDGQTYTGTTENYWSGVMHNDNFIFTNGVDPLQVKSAVASTATNMASALATNTYKAWVVASFKDHLNLYHTVENGTEQYKRIRWTKKGTLALSSSGDFDSGTAGAQDLPDAEGEIKAAAHFGATIVVYAERSIHVQFWVGGTEVYQFSKTVSGIGTPSRRGVVARADSHYFIGQDNFYEYRGGDEVIRIGDPIKRVSFGEINRVALNTAFVTYDNEFDEVLFHVPTGAATAPNKTWVYRLENQSWAYRDYSYQAKGSTTRATGTTIGELQGTIGDQTFTYGDFFIKEEASVDLFGDLSGRVVQKDTTVYSISNSGTSAAQVYEYVTPDLTGIRGGKVSDPYDKSEVDYTTTHKRWLSFDFEATGNGTAIVDYSTDGGVSYVTLPESPVTLSPFGTTHTLDLDDSSRMIRFRISNIGTNEPIGVTYCKVTFIPSTEQED